MQYFQSQHGNIISLSCITYINLKIIKNLFCGLIIGGAAAGGAVSH
jgi:hypothetical protein